MNRMGLVEANVVQCLRRRSVEDGEPALRHEGWSVRVIAGKGRCVGRRSRARGIHDEMGLMMQDGIRNEQLVLGVRTCTQCLHRWLLPSSAQSSRSNLIN